MAAEITFGKDKITGKVRHISEVISGNSCNCLCFKCNFELQARKGKKREHHFKHNNPDCLISYESALHRAAIEILVQNNQLMIPDWGMTHYHSAKAEENWNRFRPDVKISTDREEVFVEVIVTHYNTFEKTMEYLSNNITCLEIDLSSVNRDINREELEEEVLRQIDNKRLLKPIPIKTSISSSSKAENNDNVFLFALTAVIMAFILKPFIRRKRR